MPKTAPRKYQPKVHIPLSFDVAVESFLKVDPKKLPKKGKLTKAAKGKAGKKG